MQQAGEMIDVVGDAKLALNDLHQAWAGPQLRGKAAGTRAFEQTPLEHGPLPGVEFGGPAAGGASGEGPRAAPTADGHPASHAAWIDVQEACDFGGAASFLNEREGAEATIFELLRAAVGSHTMIHRPNRTIGLYFYWNQ